MVINHLLSGMSHQVFSGDLLVFSWDFIGFYGMTYLFFLGFVLVFSVSFMRFLWDNIFVNGIFRIFLFFFQWDVHGIFM